MKHLVLGMIVLLWIGNANGQSWQRVQLISDTVYGPNILDGKLFNDTVVVMGGYGKIFYSTDFFQSYSVDSAYYTNVLNVMEFVNRDSGYIQTDHVQGGFLVTADGGHTWQPLSYGPPVGIGWGDIVQFTHGDTAYSASSWLDFVDRIDMSSLSVYPITPTLSICREIVQMRVTNDSTVYILCNAALGVGYLFLLRSVNYGNTWQLIGLTGLAGYGDFRFLDDTTIIAVGNQSIAKSINSGDSFQIVMHSDNINDEVDGNRHAISFVNRDTGFVAYVGSVYKTYDAGDTWTKTDFAFDSNDNGGVNGIEFITAASSQKVIVGCFNGNIYKTENGGGVFTGVPEVSASAIFSLYPNPTSGLLKIRPPFSITARYSVEISNVIGQTIYKDYPTNNQIDVTNLAPGIYLLKCDFNGLCQTAKFVKQ